MNWDKQISQGREWTLDDFKFGLPLGQGRFGLICVAGDLKTGNSFAVKMLRKKKVKLLGENLQKILKLTHPNLTKIYGYFHNEMRYYFVMELAPDGSVYDRLLQSKESRFTDKVAATYVKQVVKALKYCHENNITNLNIFPEKLLIGFHGEIKIYDIGLSVGGPLKTRKTTLNPDLNYSSPEKLFGYTELFYTDLWSLGVLIFELLAGYPPFNSSRCAKTRTLIKTHHYSFPCWICPEAYELISQLLMMDPMLRRQLIGVLNHPWIVNNAEPNNI